MDAHVASFTMGFITQKIYKKIEATIRTRNVIAIIIRLFLDLRCK